MVIEQRLKWRYCCQSIVSYDLTQASKRQQRVWWVHLSAVLTFTIHCVSCLFSERTARTNPRFCQVRGGVHPEQFAGLMETDSHSHTWRNQAMRDWWRTFGRTHAGMEENMQTPHKRKEESSWCLLSPVNVNITSPRLFPRAALLKII